MDRNDSPRRNILGDLASVLAGVGMLALAASEVLAAGARRRADVRPGPGSLGDIMRSRPRPRRKPPEAGMPMPAVPPRGPAPRQGGAAVALDPADH